MAQTNKQSCIGFPPPLLGDVPLRLPIIAETGEWIALEKPAGVGLREYPWDSGVVNLDAALNRQLQESKPELVRRGASLFGSAYYLDPVISGVALFAKNRETLGALRNSFGSHGFTFRFLFVARAQSGLPVGATATIDAALLAHNTKPKMIPSSAKGKKSCTHFRLLEASPSGWALWEATADFLRPHQIRAHAAVLGVSVLGDVLYEGPDAPLLSDLLPGKRGPGTKYPVFEGPALHLAQVCFSVEDRHFEIGAAPPRLLKILLQRMQLS